MGLLSLRSQESGQSSSAVVTRLVALAAIGLAIIGLVAILLRSGDAYWVEADFVNASQLVEGNQVLVAGEAVGSVQDIRVTDDGQARVRLTIEEEEFAPLRAGTFATVRLLSLQGLGGTADTLDVTLKYLGPHFTVCNYFNYFFTFTADHFSSYAGPEIGFFERIQGKTALEQANSPGLLRRRPARQRRGPGRRRPAAAHRLPRRSGQAHGPVPGTCRG